jgi:hypothetical protein
MDSKVARLFSRICAFCYEEKRAIMDCPFVLFHIKASIVKHVELQNVAGTLMDHLKEQEPRIYVV